MVAGDAEAAGLMVSSYHYFRATRNACDQLRLFLHVVGDLKGQLIPTLDVEDHGAMSAADYSKSARAWLDGFEQTQGGKAILCTYPASTQTLCSALLATIRSG
jgi:GH25 family lysozyme M1 (1,4-beta-N-acetylmuramidase)